MSCSLKTFSRRRFPFPSSKPHQFKLVIFQRFHNVCLWVPWHINTIKSLILFSSEFLNKASLFHGWLSKTHLACTCSFWIFTGIRWWWDLFFEIEERALGFFQWPVEALQCQVSCKRPSKVSHCLQKKARFFGLGFFSK